MFLWSLILGGPALLPLAIVFRTNLPALASETLLVAGVVTMFLAICAGEAIGSGRQKAAGDEA